MRKTVAGVASDVQEKIQRKIDQLVESDVERGIRVAVYHGPDLVVDAVAGIADPSSGRPVTPDTPFFGMESTWALGYGIGRIGSTPQESPTVFGIGGAGGSFACADRATGITFAVTKNRLSADFSTATEISRIVTTTLS